MKRLALSAALAAMTLPAASFADSGPGCGLGAQIFKGQSGLFAHTAAATTNGTSYNQLFGLTSGTLDCDPESVVSNDFEREVFVAMNLDNLSQEMAQGGGAHLDSLASLYGISAEDKDHFLDLSQRQLPTLLQGAADADTLLSALDTAMASDPALARYVR